MYREDKNLLKDFQKTRNLTHSTMAGYKTTVELYTRQNKKSFTSLIREAEKEEKQNIQWKNRRIKQRLINFRTLLIEKDFMEQSLQHYMQRIKTLYRNYEIEIGDLPYLSKKNIKKAKPLTFNELPSKDLLKKIIPLCNPRESALTLFMLSSGCARKETLSLTIQDFINSTYDYHHSDDIEDILRILHGREDIIPTWNVYRFKTGKHYVTFSSPESTVYLVGYLLSRKDVLTADSKLFKINEHYVWEFFKGINERLNLGKVGTYNRFRSHVLRKCHASFLYSDGMSMDMVNELQGKVKGRTDSVYFCVNPIVLKREYVKHLGAVTVMSNVVDGVWGKLDLSDLEDFSKFY